MNKVVNINLNGFIFSIDEQAYELLKQYTDRLRRHFAGTEGAGEIISDIETRIAELLQQKLSGQNQVVMLEDVQQVIAMMGEPWQIDEEQQEETKKEQAKEDYFRDSQKKLRRDPSNKVISGVCSGAANYLGVDPIIFRALFAIAFFVFGSGLLIYIILWIAIPEAKTGELNSVKNAKRMFRNPDDKVLGGVCGGLGSYFAVDAVWFRIAFLAAFFFFGSGLLLYIILWMAIPVAASAAEKLQMKGEAVDVNNIERIVRDSASRSGERIRNGLSNTGNMLTDLMKNVIRLMGRVIGFVLFAAGIAVVFCLVGLFTAMQTESWTSFIHLFVDDTSTLFLSKTGLILIAVSVSVTLLTSGIKLLFGTKLRTRLVNVLMLVLFITGCAFKGIAIAQFSHSIYEKETVTEKIGKYAAPDTLYITSSGKWGELSKLKNHLGISFNDNDFFTIKKAGDEGTLFMANSLRLLPAADTAVTIQVLKTAHGSSDQDAREHINALQYGITVNGSSVMLDPGIMIPDGQTYKFEHVSVQMRIPVGTIVKVDPDILSMLNRRNDEFDLGETFIMRKGGLLCLDCADENDASFDDESDDDDEDEINIHIGDDETEDGKENVHIRIGDEERVRIRTTETTEIKDGKEIKKTVKKIGPVTITTEKEKKGDQ